jgi:hypothetical protein
MLHESKRQRTAIQRPQIKTKKPNQFVPSSTTISLFPESVEESSSNTRTTIKKKSVEEEEFDYVTLEEIVDIPVSESQCFGCLVGFSKPKNPKDEPDLDELWNIYMNEKSKLSEDELCRLLSEAQQEIFIHRVIRDGIEPQHPVWTLDQVKMHLKYHMFNYDMEVKRDIDRLTNLIDALNDRIGKRLRSDPSKVIENKEAVDLFLKAIDKKESIMSRWNKEKGGNNGGL